MKKLFLLIALMGMAATGCDGFLDEDYIGVHEIWYTTTDGKITGPIPNYQGSFGGARVLSNNYYSSHGIIRFDDEVTTIGQGAFYWDRYLESIILPNSVTSIGDCAFDGCTSLKSITIPNSVTSIGEMAFRECKSLKSITIPDGVTKIDSESFKECSSLESVSLGNGITKIGYYAFWDCSSLKSVDIPNNVTSIQQQAFVSCEKLETVTLGSGVTEIGLMAFAGCSSLKSVYCKATTPPTGDFEMFSYYSNGDMPIGCKIYVPRNSVESYKSADYWSRYADNIVGYDFDNGVIDQNVDIKVTIGSAVDITGNPDYEEDYPSDSTMCIYIKANGHELKSIKLYISTNMPADTNPEDVLALKGAKDMSEQYIPDMIEYGYTLSIFTGLTPGTTYDIFFGFTTIYGKTQYYRTQYTPRSAK